MAEQTFLFADLAGFTALTEAHGDEEAAELVDGFCRAVRELLPEHQAEEVKTIGDALMLRAADAEKALRLGLAVVNEVGARHEFPSVRVGMHTGAAVERGGDWFGATVNLAARVSGLASAGEVLLTEATLEAAGEPDDLEFHVHGTHHLKNVTQPVKVYSAWRTGAASQHGLPIDPVCRMAVDPHKAAGTLTHRDRTYHFCSLRCAATFAADPDAYAAEES